jgi:hypothetical protein
MLKISENVPFQPKINRNVPLPEGGTGGASIVGNSLNLFGV